MVTASPMAGNRSTLELMLDKIQRLDEQGPVSDELPTLPVRPVSRARLPRARKGLRFDFQTTNCNENDVSLEHGFNNNVESSIAKFDRFKGIDRLENQAVFVDKEISNIQKCYRGHRVRCSYRELKRGIITLQAFARGENARKEFHCKIKRLRAIILIQKHTRKYIQHRTLKEQHAAFTPLQSGNQGHWTQGRGNATINKPKSRDKNTTEGKDYTEVPLSVIVDLQKRVLSTEAKVREKNEENFALKTQLQEMEMRWQKYEERMKSREKSWQDQLTHVQKSLAAAKKNPIPSITLGQLLSIQEHNKQDEDGNILTSKVPSGRSLDSLYTSSNEQVDRLKLGNTVDSNPEEELRKLNHRFKAWKHNYKIKLREAQLTVKKLGSSKTTKKQKKWWGRLPH